MSRPKATVQSYQNFFVKTVSRSLGTSYDSMIKASDVTNDLADRGLAALDMALKPQIGPAVWDQTKQLLLTLSPKMEQAGRWEQWYPYLEKGLTMRRNSWSLEQSRVVLYVTSAEVVQEA